MLAIRQTDRDAVPGPHLSAGQYDAHHAGLADQPALAIAAEACRDQSWHQLLQLNARIAQAGQFHDRVAAEAQPRSAGQCDEVEAARREILAERYRREVEACRAQLIQQFRRQDMHLPQIGQSRIEPGARAVLDPRAAVRVTFDAEPREKPDDGVMCLCSPCFRPAPTATTIPRMVAI